MARTTQTQLRLHTTVERLSTIAVSYDALQFVGTVLQGVYDGTGHERALVLARAGFARAAPDAAKDRKDPPS